MGYTIKVFVDSDERRPARVRSLAAQCGGQTRNSPGADHFASTGVEFDSWENFLKFADLLIGRVKVIREEPNPHWVNATGGIPYWAHSAYDEAQGFEIHPATAAPEVAKFMHQALAKRALRSESVVKILLQ